MNTHHLKRGLAGALLGLSLWALAGCRDFPQLSLLREEPPMPVVLEISMDPSAPEEAAVTRSSGPAEDVDVAVSSEEDPRRIVITIRFPASPRSYSNHQNSWQKFGGSNHAW